MWLDSKAVNCPQKWGNFRPGPELRRSGGLGSFRCARSCPPLPRLGRRKQQSSGCLPAPGRSVAGPGPPLRVRTVHVAASRGSSSGSSCRPRPWIVPLATRRRGQINLRGRQESNRELRSPSSAATGIAANCPGRVSRLTRNGALQPHMASLRPLSPRFKCEGAATGSATAATIDPTPSCGGLNRFRSSDPAFWRLP